MFVFIAFCYLNVPDDTLFFKTANHSPRKKETKRSSQREPVKQPKWLPLDICIDNKCKEVEYK